MIWPTGRQHPAEATVDAGGRIGKGWAGGRVGGGGVIGRVAAMLVVGTVARDRAREAGVPGCSTGGGCANALEALHREFHSIPPFIAALVAIPLLAGMFWAAPLVSREYEAGAHPPARGQSGTPPRRVPPKPGLVFPVPPPPTLGPRLRTPSQP